MLPDPFRQEIDYLAIGHLTRDLLPRGERLGGSAAYAAATAAAFGLRVGIVTAWGEDSDLSGLEHIPIFNSRFGETSTFELMQADSSRKLRVNQLAPPIEGQQIPPMWLNAKIVHFAPVLGEIAPTIMRQFEASSVGITPQGWLRQLDAQGNMSLAEWPEADFVLEKSMAAVLSVEDLANEPERINSLAMSAPILAQTLGQDGARIFSQGDEIDISGIPSKEIDSTGAGDIFAAAFFIRLHFGDSLEEAGRVANLVAAKSVERLGLLGVPSKDEIFDLMPKAARG